MATRQRHRSMSVSFSQQRPGLLSCIVCSCLKLDRKRFQTRAGSVIHLDRAVVVVEGATLATFVTGTITMLIIGILLNIVGLGILCWALFALATYALPFSSA